MAQISVSAASSSDDRSSNRETESDRSRPSEVLEIDRALYNEMIDHVSSVFPCEGCGLIATDETRAVKLYRGTNTEQSETRYNMEPAEVIRALEEIRQRGWRLGAIYHSHPRTDARPSQSDLAHAYYPEALMVIISLQSDPPTTRAFRVNGVGGKVYEARIAIRP